MAKAKILFRVDEEQEWEHMVVIGSNGNLISDALENHKLSAKEVLTELFECGIIDLEVEKIDCEE